MRLNNQEALEYSKGQAIIFSDMVDNLRVNFGIENFGFLRIYLDSRYFYICNNQDLIYQYYSQINSTNIFFDKEISSAESDYQAILWPSKPENFSMDLYYSFDYWNGVTLLKKSACNKYVDLWWFATSKKNTRILDFYLNNKKLLSASVRYFSNKYHDVIESPNLAIFKNGVDLSNLDTGNNNVLGNSTANSFVKSLFPKGIEVKGLNGFVALTTRELTCLQQIAQGKTAKQIAIALGISYRTVEKFIHSIQMKTGYSLRSDLVLLYYDQVDIFLKNL